MRIGNSLADVRRRGGLARGVIGQGSNLSQQIAAFYASNVRGVWYDRSSLETLFQDATAVAPVLVPTNSVGLGFSKDLATARGPERISNGAFNGSTSWTVGGSDATHIATFSGGTLRYQSDTSSPILIVSQPSVFVVGRFYEITFDVSAWVSGTIKFDGLGGTQTVSAGAGIKKMYGVGTASTLNIYRNSTNVDLTLESVSAVEILGNHQFQNTASFKPIYQTGPKRLVFDGVDDVLNTTFATALGSSCTVGRAIPGSGAVISTGVNIGTSFADNVTASALLIADRALTVGETALWTAYLNQQSVL